jgi:hypothetical protein
MIQFSGVTIGGRGSAVVQNRRDFLNLTDAIRGEAAAVLKSVLEGASWKRVQSEDVPGAKAEFLSRAKKGCDSNPLYRIAALFLLMKRLGMGRESALRLLGWLTELVDWIWPPEETPSLETALERDSEQDPRDDHLRFMAAKGCPEARVKLIDETRREIAVNQVLLIALRQSEPR